MDTEWWQYDDPLAVGGSTMLRWLEADLRAHSESANGGHAWIVVMQHKMPYPNTRRYFLVL